MAPRGKQNLTRLRDKLYIHELGLRERSTARQINEVIGGSLAGTLNTLKRMFNSGLIGGEQVGNRRTWEFWAVQE